MRCKLLGKVICSLSLFLIIPINAKELNSLQYDARLCSAQLLVIRGDLSRLQLDDTKHHHKTGLKQRIAGALGTLAWLCKQNSFEKDLDFAIYKKQIENIQYSFETEKWQILNTELTALVSKMPLNEDTFNFKQLSKNTLDTSISIYKHYCKACHDKPSSESKTPAYSLFEMVKQMPRNEFLARMIVGVHGTPKIALRNPLTDDDISGMTYYFENTASDNPTKEKIKG